MKKSFLKLAGLALAAALALGVSGCSSDSDSSSHVHTFATEWTKDATHHWHAATCEHTSEVKDKAEHNFGEWTTTEQPSEEAEGKRERKCSDCQYFAEETIAKLDHVHAKGTHHEAVASTCKTKGTIAYYDCTKSTCVIKLDADGNPLASTESELDPSNHEGTEIAFEKIDTDSHKEKYKCCNAVKTESAPHNWNNGEVTKTPTTTEEGEKTFTCTAEGCGQTKTEPVAKLSAIPEGFVKVTGGTVTGVAYTDNYVGVFPAGRNVTLSPFYMGKYEVTQAEYKSVMEGQKVTVDGTEYTLAASPSYCVQGSTSYKVDSDKDHANYPVENVTWFDAVYYCNALSAKENLDPCYTITVTAVSSSGHITAATVEYDKTKKGYRLPTEAEWEYAARGGDPTAADWNYTFSGANKAEGTSYSDSKNTGLDSVGWYCYNNISGTTGDTDVTNSADGKGTHEVGSKTNGANRLGIYDMSGNVWEWCYDRYGSTASETVTDPAGASSGDIRVYRGGGWYDSAYGASVSYRDGNDPDYQYFNLGFRVCRSSSMKIRGREFPVILAVFLLEPVFSCIRRGFDKLNHRCANLQVSLVLVANSA